VVAVADNPAAELLDELYLNSLLAFDETTERYDLHDLARAFALARLTTDGDEPATRLRHARYYQQVAHRAQFELYLKGKPHDGLALFDRERRQIDAGWQWAMNQSPSLETDNILFAFANATVNIGTLRYNLRLEKIPQLEAQLAVVRRQGHEALRGTVLNNLCKIYNQLGEHQKALRYGYQALLAFQKVNEYQGFQSALCNIGISFRNLGNQETARQCLEYALAIALLYDDLAQIGVVLGLLGAAYFTQDNYKMAMRHTERHLILARKERDKLAESTALGNFGLIYYCTGDHYRAFNCYEQAITIDKAIGNQEGVARHSWNLGLLYEQQGDLARAVALMQVWVDFLHQIGHADAEQDAAQLDQVRQKLAKQSG
jgi:tetratricopeptide (TPR) repeat protein